MLMPRQSKPPNLVAVMLYKLNVFILNVGVQKIKTKTRDGDRFFDIKTKKKEISVAFSFQLHFVFVLF